MGKFTAAFLSLLVPGLGQFYAGRLWRGVLIFLLTALVGLLTMGLALPLMWIVAVVDAYMVYGNNRS